MSKPREPWWGYVKNVIRSYPHYREELQRIKSTSVTPSYSKGGGRGRSCRKTELTALRSLPPKVQERYDAVEKALRKTKRLPDGEQRIRFIELVYMKGSRNINIQHAAVRVFTSNRTALRWNRDFIYLVADYLNLT